MDVHELTAAYALDALDAEERARYEEHLALCDACRAELAQLRDTAGALAYAAEGPPPAPELRARILAAAAADNVVPIRRRAWAVPALAVAACAIAALAVWAATLSHSLSQERQARADAASALAVLADPRASRAALTGAAGTVAIDTDGHGVLVVRGLAEAPAGKTYEAWVIPPGAAPRAAGLFRGGTGTTVVPLTVDVPRGATIAATVERAGGVARSKASPFIVAHTT